MAWRKWLSPLVYLSNNWISLVGVVLVTAATVTWMVFLPITIRGGVAHPYFGLAVYLVLPGVFVLGLLLIPIGIVYNRWRRKSKGLLPADFPPLDLQNPELRRLLGFIALTTFLNIIIASQFSYSAVNYMDSTTFCGQTCHVVMKPEFTAHQRSPHSRVECVSCHIGAGASWFVRSKLSGAGQVVAVALNNYPRPIPAPVKNLRPARETCETCHWPQKFDEDRLRDIVSYGIDEQNTPTHTVLLLHLGGGPSRVGIHGRHLGQGVTVRYFAADEKRENIPYVEYSSGGATTIYAASGTKPPDPAQLRVMDCIDCHNRPTHILLLPERAMDKALEAGEISPTLPFIKKQGVEVLKQNYSSSADAAAKIPAAVEAYYRASQPQVYAQRKDDVAQAAKGVLAIYQRNVFPEMKVTWGTYANNVGHTDFTGCFRCHDEAHTAANGKTITQDCSACHNLLASDEKNPKVLTEVGLEKPATDAGKKEEPKKK
ncbi:MAG TPA: NapC/NirT family cytochrome c [Terriglobales bacterium]|nr:NapC/NirT family cytochrome c [Terriglobales bacterium]